VRTTRITGTSLVGYFIQVYLYLYEYLSNLIPVNLLVHTTYEDGTECSETSEHKIQTPENDPPPKKGFNNAEFF
jgi:hypothetical protein